MTTPSAKPDETWLKSTNLPRLAFAAVVSPPVAGALVAIILSMTPKERSNPDLINGSRRKRLATGSGTSVEEVNGLLKQLYEMRKGMKQMGKLQERMKKRGGKNRFGKK